MLSSEPGEFAGKPKEVAHRFETVSQSYQEAQTVVQPLIDYFEDIRRALNSDLTRGGLAAVKDIVGNADDNAAKVQCDQRCAMYPRRLLL